MKYKIACKKCSSYFNIRFNGYICPYCYMDNAKI